MAGYNVRPKDCSKLKVAPKFGIALRLSILAAIEWVGGVVVGVTSFHECRRRFCSDGVLINVIKGEDTLDAFLFHLFRLAGMLSFDSDFPKVYEEN